RRDRFRFPVSVKDVERTPVNGYVSHYCAVDRRFHLKFRGVVALDLTAGPGHTANVDRKHARSGTKLAPHGCGFSHISIEPLLRKEHRGEYRHQYAEYHHYDHEFSEGKATSDSRAPRCSPQFRHGSMLRYTSGFVRPCMCTESRTYITFCSPSSRL